MSLLQDLRSRFSKAASKAEELSEAFSEAEKKAQLVAELNLAIEAEEAAALHAQKRERFKAIMRNLPVLAGELDQAAQGILGSWNAIELAHREYNSRMKELLLNHNLDHRFDVEGRRLPGSYETTDLPAWIPARNRARYRDGKLWDMETLHKDLYGKTFGRALSDIWAELDSEGVDVCQG